MKPTKNQIFCPECRRTKMLFEAEKKALLFMKFNNDNISKTSTVVPQRAYFCIACGGWHLTHRKEKIEGPSKTELMIEKMHNAKKEKKNNNKESQLKREENANYFADQLRLVDNHLQFSEKEQALTILNSLLELTKTKYIKPKTIKRIKTKIEQIK